ncbi:hypothetical protein [Spiroplasma citri]|uniref:Transmembrane protein n=1 Tax=Spiroplasma citri TaxID=2133 RepID=A0AAJ4EIE4_SPICI|nr:hypothetical protein [Spiroplasma citri]APE74321.1 hypothetical protein SCITRI_00416 [Spiroplasma citri]QIA66543.1 hypothetical protein GMI18_01945 [Spiroplasma citri]QIA68423.1 hypothetical protein GL298_02065 [Spiroplasma citri]QIA70298.1 hypothetical protein GL981_02070 [Spiroplasma citri]QIA72532.1 hypothetical protein GL982_02085 [Spiroplasma citri]
MKKTKNSKTINQEQSAKVVKTMQLIVDNRPPVLKNLDKTVIDKTVKSLGEYELNRKQQIRPLPYQYNLEASKYYFSTKSETIARTLIVFSQLLLIVVALIYLPTLGQVGEQLIISLLSKFKTPFTEQIVTIGQPIVIGIIILLAILWIATFFFITIPILITKTLKTVNIWTIIVSIVGNINCFSVLGLAILQFVYVKNSVAGLNINTFILPSFAIIAFCCFILGCLFLKSDRKKYQINLENEIANQIRALRE